MIETENPVIFISYLGRKELYHLPNQNRKIIWDNILYIQKGVSVKESGGQPKNGALKQAIEKQPFKTGLILLKYAKKQAGILL